ncbi:hypothetical protein GX865_02630 [Candidatus Saccharibacteria bacterium]|nr:hypothetical protein [Candidatus Saccharibacteria bacterium]
MARNHNKFPSGAETATQDEDFEGGYKNLESSAEQSFENPADSNVESATDRMATVGSEFLSDMKDLYGNKVDEARETFEDLKEKASHKLKNIGKATAKFAEKAGLSAIGASVMGVRAGREMATNAKQNINERIQDYKERRHQQELDSAHSEAIKEDEERAYNKDYASGQSIAYKVLSRNERLRRGEGFAESLSQEDRNTRASNEFNRNPNEFLQDNYGFDYSPETEGGYIDGWEAVKQAIVDRAHEEALAMNEDYDEQKRSERMEEMAREYMAYRAYQAQRRAELRQQTYEATVGRASQWYNAAKSRVSKTGRSIASFAKRTVDASRAARAAAKESWQVSAE